MLESAELLPRLTSLRIACEISDNHHRSQIWIRVGEDLPGAVAQWYDPAYLDQLDIDHSEQSAHRLR